MTSGKRKNAEPKQGRLRLWIGDRKLTGEEMADMLSRLNEKHAHTLGREAPRQMREEGRDLTGCTGKCQRGEGFYVGHGTCILKHFVNKEPFCATCRSEEITAQINWVFTHFKKRFPEGLRAQYDPWKAKRKRKIKEKIE
jgi:hypothetical protein